MDGKCPFCKKNRMKVFDEISDEAVKIAKEFTKRSLTASGMDEKDKIIFLSGAVQMLTEYMWQEHERICKLGDGEPIHKKVTDTWPY